MSDKVRTFDFPRGISLHSALRIVAAALEDEGLQLLPGGQGFVPGHGILQGDTFRVIVPVRNIIVSTKGMN